MSEYFPHENYPTDSVEAFMTAEDMSATIQTTFDQLGEEQGRGVLSDDEKRFIFDKLRGGASYFYDLAREAGALAGEGDAVGALSLLGGEDNAKDLIGDENTNELLALVAEQIANEVVTFPEV